MVYFENALRWSFFHHSLKLHGPSWKKEKKKEKSCLNL
jgi:hypothetical protein